MYSGTFQEKNNTTNKQSKFLSLTVPKEIAINLLYIVKSLSVISSFKYYFCIKIICLLYFAILYFRLNQLKKYTEQRLESIQECP